MKTSGQPGQTRGALSPIVAFAVLTALVAAGAAYVLTRPTAPTTDPATASEPSPTPSDHQLTDAEAIARFKDLDAIRVQALEDRNIQALAEVATAASPVVERVRQTVADLRRNNVVVDEQWEVRSVSVLERTSSSIKVRAVGISDVEFFDEQGNEVAGKAPKERRIVHCALRLENSGWLLHECDVHKVVRLPRERP